jgi:hypothetical protein
MAQNSRIDATSSPGDDEIEAPGPLDECDSRASRMVDRSHKGGHPIHRMNGQLTEHSCPTGEECWLIECSFEVRAATAQQAVDKAYKWLADAGITDVKITGLYLKDATWERLKNR